MAKCRAPITHKAEIESLRAERDAVQAKLEHEGNEREHLLERNGVLRAELKARAAVKAGEVK